MRAVNEIVMRNAGGWLTYRRRSDAIRAQILLPGRSRSENRCDRKRTSRANRVVSKSHVAISSMREINLRQTKTPPPEGDGVLFDRDT
jgi:hypothetical protein